MWLLILIIIVVLLIKSGKKKNNVHTKQNTRTHSGKTPQKYKDMIRTERNMDKLSPDGELPIGWVTVYEDFIQSATFELMTYYADYREHQYGDPKKKYIALKSLLLYFEDAKKRYAKKGECFLFWFVETWAKPEELQMLSNDLKYLEEHYDELEKEYKRKQYVETFLIPDIKEKVIKIIKDNPEILQTDVYSYFDSENKKYVQSVLYQLSEDRKIKREKQGRTYKLSIQK